MPSRSPPRSYDEVWPEPLCLAGRALALLGGSVQVDERISWYQQEDHGRYLPFNSYLLREQDSVFLLESGVPVILDRIAGQLRWSLDEQVVVPRLAVTRNEPDCVSNVPDLVRQFGLKMVHSPGLMNTLQFFEATEAARRESSFNHQSAELQMLSYGVGCTPAISGGQIELAGDRVLEIVAVSLRVLPTVWYYDRKTKTMFCSDSFSDETAREMRQRLLVTTEDKDVLVGRFHRHFEGKFDWLVRSDLSSVIAELEGIFSSYDIEILAPTRGLVVYGRQAVQEKKAALLEALRTL